LEDGKEFGVFGLEKDQCPISTSVSLLPGATSAQMFLGLSENSSSQQALMISEYKLTALSCLLLISLTAAMISYKISEKRAKRKLENPLSES
jgi:hypothetical protein